VAAHGGRQNLVHLENLKVVSKGRFKNRVDFWRTLLFRAPATWSMRIDGLGGNAMAFGVDGDRCWRKARQFVSPCSPADRQEYRRITDVLDAQLLQLDGRDLTSAGTVLVDGSAAPALRAGDLLLVFDPVTHLLVQARYDEGWVESFTDYRLVAGAQIAARRTLTIDGQPDIDETSETIVPGGADDAGLRAPPLMDEGVTVDEVDPERTVAWMEVTDLELKAREAVDLLTKFAESKALRTSSSDGIIVTEMAGAPPATNTRTAQPTPRRERWQVAISLEAGAPMAPLTEGAIHLESWPAARVVGVFRRGDPHATTDARAAVQRHMDQAGLVAAPQGRWQLLYPPGSDAEPFASRLALLRVAVVPK
jgi:hypothetical protein